MCSSAFCTYMLTSWSSMSSHCNMSLLIPSGLPRPHINLCSTTRLDWTSVWNPSWTWRWCLVYFMFILSWLLSVEWNHFFPRYMIIAWVYEFTWMHFSKKLATKWSSYTLKSMVTIFHLETIMFKHSRLMRPSIMWHVQPFLHFVK